MKKNWIKRILWIAVLAIIIIVAMKIRQHLPAQSVGGTEAQEAKQADAAAAGVIGLPSDEGFTKAAETDQLELYFRSQDSALQVKDKRDGHVWRSAYPLKDANVDGNDLWKSDSQSIFHLSYTNPNTPTLEVLESNSVLLQPQMESKPIENGISVHYDLQQLKLSFTMQFQLNNGGLEVHVPADSIKESEEYVIMRLSPLPFFGAAGDEVEGYGFYPDGPGAISYFKPNHPQYMEPYHSAVFGSDQISFNDYNQPENAYLPVFGMKVKNNAFMGIITEGEFDSSVVYAPSGYLINLNRTSAELTYRRSYEAVKQNGNLAVRAEKNVLRENHTIRYLFYGGDEANYSHMAVSYRGYLLKEKGLIPRMKKGDPIPLGVDLLMGIKQQRILTDRFLPTTTFEQAAQILKDLHDKGIESISANLLGWTKQGFGFLPSELPASSQLGSMNGLEALSRMAKENGVRLYLTEDFVHAFKGGSNGSFSERDDVIKGANHFPVTDPYNVSFLLNARKRNLFFQNTYLKNLKSLPISGMQFDAFGTMNYFDYNDTFPLTREGTAAEWMEMMGKSRSQFGGAAVTGGNSYVLPYADRIFSLGMQDSGFFFTDETVPFYQMVIHGVIPYSGIPQNLFHDPQMQFLKMVEYGYMPFYQLTYQHSDELKDTFFADLFSSRYSSWSNTVVKTYKEMSDKLRISWSQPMVDHRKLKDRVFQTTYEDGTRVIVNYGTDATQINGHSVPGENYAVLPKEG
ncbi:DUF5696 domain-containing protein [Paenibacillus alginolyticus]|uniref:DUF5696 domain-containing protein n=1 Tax=Paenibacillus alginolyticus TaxID=59839 RepID=A0ABT4GCD3_9BACL|nr:DUF5696 domain-containing protein [Paenibacillus alginolyticus]MCY9693853.1 DUF5696 domain-containing protein [Paenibacillus alginolyticus]MEC0148188.1 DUF5696 domain-containing protein [Paenibacillus alginolyticus]